MNPEAPAGREAPDARDPNRLLADARLQLEQARRAVRESEERLQEALYASRSFAFEWEPAADIVRRSLSCSMTLGLSDAEATDDTGRSFFQRIHPDDRARFTSMLGELRPGADRYQTRYRAVRPDGQVVTLEESGRGYFDEAGTLIRLLGITTDVTAREQAEEARRKMEDRLRVAKDAAGLGIHDYDVLSGRVEWDPRVREIFGVHDDEPITYDLFLASVHPDDREGVHAEMAKALDPRGDGRYYREYRAVNRRDGRERWVAATGQTFFAGGRAVRLIGTAQDITERKRIEEALRHANAQLAESDHRKDEFIAILSHELRNPIAPIRYALPLLGQESLTETGSRALAVIDRQVTHLTRLVDDLLDVSRITTGRIELRPERVTLASVISAAVEAASPAIATARHSLDILVEESPIWLLADPARIAQVVTNLLDNSAKYTPAGGRLTLQAGRERDQAVIRVRDNGSGIAADALGTIFEMFRRGREGTQAGGFGIGLALARRLVEMHGGSIEACSAGPHQGAEFVVRLPVAEAAADPAPDGQLSAAGEPVPLRVLVVDDNLDLLEMLALVVEAGGHEVWKATDGRSALSAALSYRPHVVLLDLGLPGMSGIDVAKALRKHPQTSGTCLIALTGWGQPEDRRQTAEAGFNHHVTKPADADALQQLLAEIAKGLAT